MPPPWHSCIRRVKIVYDMIKLCYNFSNGLTRVKRVRLSSWGLRYDSRDSVAWFSDISPPELAFHLSGYWFIYPLFCNVAKIMIVKTRTKNQTSWYGGFSFVSAPNKRSCFYMRDSIHPMQYCLFPYFSLVHYFSSSKTDPIHSCFRNFHPYFFVRFCKYF